MMPTPGDAGQISETRSRSALARYVRERAEVGLPEPDPELQRNRQKWNRSYRKRKLERSRAMHLLRQAASKKKKEPR